VLPDQNSNGFFGDNNPNFNKTVSAKRIGNYIHGLINENTGEEARYVKVTSFILYGSNVPMSDSFVDGFIYRKDTESNEYFKLIYNYLYPELFGAIGDNLFDCNPAFSRAISFLEKIGFGTLTLKPGSKYNCGEVILTKPNISIVGDSSSLLYGTIKVNGNTRFEEFNSGIYNVRFRRPTPTYGEFLTNNNAIELRYVRSFTINGCNAVNTNSLVYIKQTGESQNVSRISITNNKTLNTNYSIIQEATGATESEEDNRIGIGDITISLNTWANCAYSHVKLRGVDGLTSNGNTYFFAPAISGQPSTLTKKHNIDIYKGTWISLSDDCFSFAIFG